MPPRGQTAMLEPAPHAPADWGALAAQEFDKVCALMPERNNERIARRLSDMLGYGVSRFAVANWRNGRTNVQYRVVCAARAAAGIRISLDLNLEALSRELSRPTVLTG